MADENDKKDPQDSDDSFKFPSESFETSSGGGDDDLGSLPPLSDFESADADSGGASGGDPGSGGSGSDAGGDFGSLPPLSDIDVNTPGSGGDAPASTPPGFDSGTAFNTPASDGDLDTPTPGNLDTPEQAGQTAFQDLQADSDFSPETPEIGPGPDSDLETPMFDSAFGGGASELTPPPPSATDTPTMAMDTPMFESSGESTSSGGGDFGFDDGAFGGGGGAPGGFDSPAGGGTPVPDITDTGFPAGGATPAPTPFGGGDDTGTPAPVAAGGGGGGGTSRTALIIAAVVALIVGLAGGIFGGPMILDGGNDDELLAKDQQITQLQGRISQLEQIMNNAPAGSEGKSPKQLQADIERLLQETATATQNLETATAEAEKARADYESVQADLDDANNAFVAQQQELENLQNALSITRAQQEGLLAEITRFQNLVGELEEANARRLQSRDTLLTSLGRLEALINEGSPLTPAKYNRDDRIARVTDLKSRVQSSTWVSAQLLNEYTSLYIDELQIGGSREYFFAQIPVENKLGTIEMKWAECLMNGNWSVFFRTLDGKSVGIYQNTSQVGPAEYKFRQFLDKSVESNVEHEIFAARPIDWQEKIAIVAERELASDDRHQMQKWYDSL